MIIIVAIVGIVLAISFPYFGTIARRARVESEARTINMILLEARLQAIKRGTNVFVEISTNAGKASYRRPVMFLDTGSTTGSFDTTDTMIATANVIPGGANDSIAIDDQNSASPSAASRTIEFVFTPFGAMTGSSTMKAVYVGDVAGNLLQVAIPANATGRVVTTKRLGSGFVGRPWTWS